MPYFVSFLYYNSIEFCMLLTAMLYKDWMMRCFSSLPQIRGQHKLGRERVARPKGPEKGAGHDLKRDATRREHLEKALGE